MAREPPAEWRSHEHYAYRILYALLREPERTAVIASGLSLTAKAFAAWILQAAALLRRAGITSRDTVAILTEANHPRMLASRYAANLLGAAAVCVRSNNARSDEEILPAADQARMLAETGASLLVADHASITRARDLCAGLACDAVAAGEAAGQADPPSAAELLLVSDALSTLALGDVSVTPAGEDHSPADNLVITYTSGSTGKPKGVCHSYRGWNSLVAGFQLSLYGSRPTFLAVTPIAQTAGLMADATLAAGGTLVVKDRFTVEGALQAFAELGVTDCYLAVPHLYGLADHPATRETDLARLRRVIYSGSPATPHRIAAASRVFGPRLMQSYGSTEAGPISLLLPHEHADPGLLPTVGRPYPGVRVRVCDPDPDHELTAGATGEIWVRSRHIMDGYVGDPQLTAKVLRDGWVRTGDLGYRDERGYLRLVDRVDHVIKNGGLKVYPATIEAALMSHRSVSGAAVFGIRNACDIEEAYAAVTFRPGEECAVSELHEHLSTLLSPGQAPATIAQWAELPVDGAGKTDKRRMRMFVETGVADDMARSPEGRGSVDGQR